MVQIIDKDTFMYVANEAREVMTQYIEMGEKDNAGILGSFFATLFKKYICPTCGEKYTESNETMKCFVCGKQICQKCDESFSGPSVCNKCNP